MKDKELKEFYKMTKPLKFRTLKMLLLWIEEYIKAVIYNIIYIYYYILYKLNIIKLYKYINNEDKVIDENNHKMNLSCNNLRARIKIKVIKRTKTDKEYFTTKKHFKKLFVVEDSVIEDYYVVGSLEDISVRIDKEFIPLNKPVKLFAFSQGYTLNTDLIKGVTKEILVEKDFITKTKRQRLDVYNEMQRYFKSYFKDFSINNIMIRK